MEKINFKKIFEDLTIKSMLNNNNKDLYIENITIETVEKMLTGADDELVDCFWTAFNFTHSYMFHDYELAVYQDYHFREQACPECGCLNYVEGVACPNCE